VAGSLLWAPVFLARGREHLFPGGSRFRSMTGAPRPFELGSRDRGRSSRSRADATDQIAASGDVFVAHGRDWKVAFKGLEVLVPDAIGIRQLRHLLARPGMRILSLELANISAAGSLDGRMALAARASMRAGDDPGAPASCRETEWARINVTRTIKRAIAAISDRHPTLGEHLRHTVRTGAACSYLPDPAYPRAWRTEPSVPRSSTQEPRRRLPKAIP
jgi:hypothetical protein